MNRQLHYSRRNHKRRKGLSEHDLQRMAQRHSNSRRAIRQRRAEFRLAKQRVRIKIKRQAASANQA